MIPAPLHFHVISSCDYFVAGDVALHYTYGNVQTWTGTVTSMVTGFDAVGQAMRAPTNVRIDIQDADKFDTFYIHARVRQTTLANEDLFSIVDSAAGNVIRVRGSVTGAVAVVVGAASYTASNTMVVNTWYSVELLVRVVDGATGSFELRFDGVEVEAQTDIDTNGTGNAADRLEFDGAVLDVDDVIVKTGYGGYTSSEFLNDTDDSLRIATLSPDAVGKYDGAWTQQGTPTGADLWTVVDELPFDDGPSTGNSARSGTKDARFSSQLDATNVTVAATTVVHAVGLAVKMKTSATAAVRLLLINPQGGLSQQLSANISPNVGSHRIYTSIWPKNFRTDTAWTGADMDALEWGAEISTAPSASNFVNIAGGVVDVVYSTPPAVTAPVYFTAGSQALLERNAHRMASCYQLTRRDGTVLRFVDHDRPLVVDGNTYSPLDGVSASATRREAAMREENRAFLGVLSSAAITEDDLRAGRYNQGVIEEFLVDFAYPFEGKFHFKRYWLGDINWNGSSWEAEANGVNRWLRTKIGDTFSKHCRHILGGVGCTKPLQSYTFRSVAVDSLPVSGSESFTFRADTTHITASLAADYFAFGLITWETGDNWGLSTVVKTYAPSTREFVLAVPMPNDIAVGDRFTAIRGCDKLYQTCKGIFNNLANFGGFPWIPGTDRLLDTPQT